MIDFSKTSSSSKLDSTRAHIYPTSKGTDTCTHSHSHSQTHMRTCTHTHTHTHMVCVSVSAFAAFIKYDRNIDSSCAAMRCNRHLPSSLALLAKMASHRSLFEEAGVGSISAWNASATMECVSSKKRSLTLGLRSKRPVTEQERWFAQLC